MPPKKKAEEIWMKFFQKQIELNGNGDGNLAVEESMIAVELILDLPINEWSAIEEPYQDYKYWREVKKELEKM
jgi:hypothetical protein